MSSVPYERLVGKVSELSTMTGRQDFVWRQGDRDVGAVAATGLALEGLAGAAASTAASQGDATDPIMTFQCRVGPYPVTGFLGNVGFVDEDEVIVLGQRQGDTWVARAVARPLDRTIWMPPHSGRGHRAFLKMLLLGWGSACLLGSFLFAMVMDIIHGMPMDWFWWLTSSLVTGTMLMLVVGLVAWRVYPYAVMSSRLFQALGLPNPSRVNLPRLTRQYLRGTPDATSRFHPMTPWVFRY